MFYVFGKKNIDIDHCVSSLGEILRSSSGDSPRSTAILRHDVAYVHQAGTIPHRYLYIPLNGFPSGGLVEKLRQELVSHHIELLYSPIPTNLLPGTPNGTTPPTPAETTAILYVGGECLGLTNLLMTNALSEVGLHDHCDTPELSLAL